MSAVSTYVGVEVAEAVASVSPLWELELVVRQLLAEETVVLE